MKAWTWIVGVVVASVAWAEELKTEVGQATFATGWRATGFIRQGQREEASLERTGLMPRFVKKGDRLPGDIVVLNVTYDERSVVLGKGKETALIQQETAMMASAMTQPSALKPASRPILQAAVATKPVVEKVTTTQDESRRRGAAFQNGKSPETRGLGDRSGGVSSSVSKAAMPSAGPATDAAGRSVDTTSGLSDATTASSDWKPPTVDKATAVQDPSGRWLIAFPNGKSLDMQIYVDRQGSVPAAIQYVQGLVNSETDPERVEYRKQQLLALKQMSKTAK